MQPTREAALKPTSAGLYPYLPARIWTAATIINELVACYQGTSAKPADRADRVLSDAHFVFRGGEGPGALSRPKDL